MLGPEKRSTQLGRSAYAPLIWTDQLSGAGSPGERTTFCHDHARPGEALHSTGPISLLEQEAHERATFSHDHAQEAHERELRSLMTRRLLNPGEIPASKVLEDSAEILLIVLYLRAGVQFRPPKKQ
ncbi:hypothetical protein RRG08_006452 [Elysia crispata]|uniref:Uncharacterized protein n=1 Tax=Elysia crispata TaxID=231223 RepID=A0AAE1DHN7_9GAST|nr:hypothetical protein RRG08_006452 [Elysia crispata]